MFYERIQFHHLLCVERKRSERTGAPFLLILIDLSELQTHDHLQAIHDKIKWVLSATLRESDICGWYEQGRVMGVIATKITATDPKSIETAIGKVHGRMCRHLPGDWVRLQDISYHLFPEMGEGFFSEGWFDRALYPDLTHPKASRRVSLMAKTLIDVTISALALVLLFPLFLLIAVAIKATSPGPVFFRQQRMGLNGKTFTFLKFRSMQCNCDTSSHESYIRKLIHQPEGAAVEPGVFKLTNDNRITPIGHFLRKSSLDELPQFINVLLGDMSLVGPRPPIPYEFELYDIWHRRRLLLCKPGITGLWQVMGRSSTSFNEMVRLDLKYVREWNLWLDLKILLLTPRAVFSGKGAY